MKPNMGNRYCTALTTHDVAESRWASIARGSAERPQRQERSLVSDPHRARPDQLAISLLAADIVIGGLTFLRRAILPAKLHRPSFRLGRVDIFSVLDDVNFGKVRRSHQLHGDRRRF